MSFLKKFGKVLVNIIGIVTVGGPLISAAIPGDKDDKAIAKARDTLEEISGWVMITEGMFAGVKDASGAQKLEAALPFVAQAIQRSEFMLKREIMDEEKFTAAIRTITSGIADLLNSLKDNDVEIKK